MALPAFSLPRSTSFFEPFRLQYFASLSLSAPLRPTPGLGIRPVPHVLFIEHPASSRRYRLGEYEGLVGLLRRLEEEGKATVSMPEWETLDLKHKTMETGRADVMLGTHDESLAWAMWMPRGGAVIEVGLRLEEMGSADTGQLLPAGAFTLDYAAVAEAVSHSYTAVVSISVSLSPAPAPPEQRREDVRTEPVLTNLSGRIESMTSQSGRTMRGRCTGACWTRTAMCL